MKQKKLCLSFVTKEFGKLRLVSALLAVISQMHPVHAKPH